MLLSIHREGGSACADTKVPLQGARVGPGSGALRTSGHRGPCGEQVQREVRTRVLTQPGSSLLAQKTPPNRLSFLLLYLCVQLFLSL